MSTDWHPYIEEKVDGAWQPKWKPIPHPRYWHDDLIDSKINDGSARLFFPNLSDRDLYEALVKYYDAMPWSQIVEEFSDHPDVTLLWREHHYEGYWDDVHAHENPKSLDMFSKAYYDGRDFSTRDYQWFGLFGVRNSGRGDLLYAENIPEDASPAVRREWDRRGEHTPGHIGIADLYDQLEGNDAEQLNWLKTHIDNPEQCRIIFWFDS